ncbi:MAG: acetate/propionate family kinase [Polyangiaceae bacterium]|nr:acetate/propionate family kinase [Polyangiaceae bacterium]
MRTLTLRPGPRAIGFAAFATEESRPSVRGKVHLPPSEDLRAGIDEALAQILGEYLCELPRPDLVVIHGVHDGHTFAGPAMVTSDSISALRQAASAAPLHVPPTVQTAAAIQRHFPGVPAVFVFESTFFATLPVRERLYALDRGTRAELHAARSGFRGLFHAEAAEAVARYRAGLGGGAPARIASVCLESKPEVAGILGRRPMLVTSGTTPLEGLPGEHNSGEMDPGIVLALAQTQALGPDELNEVFTHHSGLSALSGRDMDLEEVLTCTEPSTQLARDVFAHRLLIACGAAAAAVGGLDALVFSGGHASAGAALQGRLVEKLSLALAGDPHSIDVVTIDLGIDEVLCRAGAQAWRAMGEPVRSRQAARPSSPVP